MVPQMYDREKRKGTVAWIRSSKAAQIDGIGPFWLRNYFERVIRNNDDLERMRLYIRDNPHKLGTREQ